MSRLLIATNNRGKQREFRELLAGWPGELVFPQDLGIELDVQEIGDSFAEIAALKARAFALVSGLPTLADDSGLEVDALDGAPGVYSARYAGPDASDADRYRKLLGALKDTPQEHRTARFRCAVSVACPDEGDQPDGPFVQVVEGTCEGWIALEPKGDRGFGYDPVFYVPEFGCTMGELAAEIKNRISHRARAIQAARPLLDALCAR
jgi:XTP/dITP diphosphohydrolase